MFSELLKIDERPKPFEHYTAKELWDDDHISKKMLAMHLNPDVEPASRRGSFVDASVKWITSRFQVGPGLRLADFGCGPGLYTTPLARKGAEVTGLDFSRRSIAHAKKTAREEGLEIEYVLGNYLDYDSDKRFDLVTLIYCDFCPLSPNQRKTLLEVIRRHLAEGGRLLLDVFSIKAFEGRREGSTFGRNLMDGFWANDDYMGFLRTYRYEEEKVVLDMYTVLEPHRQRVIYNWLQYFPLEGIIMELEDSGFKVEGYYADVTGQPYTQNATEIAVVARKN